MSIAGFRLQIQGRASSQMRRSWSSRCSLGASLAAQSHPAMDRDVACQMKDVARSRNAAAKLGEMTKPFVLVFDSRELEALGLAYSYSRDASAAMIAGADARSNGRYTREGALAVIRWKSPRRLGRFTASDAEVQSVTARAFGVVDEAGRMGTLTSLSGVEVPVGSALLTYAFGDSYPILDRYAVLSLGHRPRGRYPTSFWIRYLNWTRSTADACGLTARDVDKALWEHGRDRRTSSKRVVRC